MFVYQPTSKGTISRLKRFPPDCRSWGSGEMCSLLVSRQLGKAGSPSVRGDTRDGGKGLHEVRSLKSTRTTGTARMSAFVASCCHLRLWSHVLDCICYNDSGTSVSASCKQMALLTLEHFTMTGKLCLVFGPRSTAVQFPRASRIRKKRFSFLFPVHIRVLRVRLETSPGKLGESLDQVLASMYHLRRLRSLEIQFRGCPRAEIVHVQGALSAYFSRMSIYQLRQLGVVLRVSVGVTEKLAGCSMGTCLGIHHSLLLELMEVICLSHSLRRLSVVHRGEKADSIELAKWRGHI